MKLKTIMAAALLFSFAACSKPLIQNGSSERQEKLKLSVSTEGESKAMVTGSLLDNGSEVGVALFSTDGEPYDGLPYGNVRFTAHASSSSQTWIPDSEIMLSASKAVLYSYYPYSSAVTSIQSIPVTADSSTQTDFMFGTRIQGLYNHSASASITLNHALSAISISLKKGSYTGDGNVTGIAVRSAGISSSATLDATNGELSSFSGEDTWISPVLPAFGLDGTGKECNVIVIPNGRKEQIEIRITIDGEVFPLTTEAVTLTQGSVLSYNVTVNNGSADISGMTVNEWGYTPGGDPVIEKDYRISMTGDIEGISFDNKVNPDGSVQIIAVPYLSEDAEVNPVEFTGNATLTQEVYRNNGVRIITISDIRSDISVIFKGCCLWVTATYEINDISSPVSIYYHTAGRSNNPVRMQIDDEEVTPSASYTFRSTGEHKIRYAFKDKTDIGYSFFTDISTLTSVRIPEGVKTLGHGVFFGSRRLVSVSLPESITTIGYECFRDASSLKSIRIPETALNLGTALFRGCSSLSDVRIPSGLVKLPDTIFRECTSLESLVLNEGLTTIGSSAFIYSGIKSIDLPASVTYLDSDALSNCYSLASITCRAVSPPELYAYSDNFIGIRSDGVIYVPSGSEAAYQSQWLKGQLLNKNWTISTIQ